MGGRSMEDVGCAVLAGSSPPFLGRERAAVDFVVGPERRSPRYHETCVKIPRMITANDKTIFTRASSL